MTLAGRRAAAVLGLAAAVAAGALATSAAGSTKPSLKITGISLNMQNVPPGTKITRKSPVNACYGIGGPTLDPPSLTVVAFVHAVGVPRNAPTTLDFTTPWGVDYNGALHATAKFSKLLYTDKGHGVASIFGGAEGPYDFFHYLAFPSGTPTSNAIDGHYAVAVTVKLPSKTLHAAGAITVEC